jgi:hypothetical protein
MRRISFLAAAIVLAGTLAAQSVVFSNSYRAFHSFVGPRMIVRDRAGVLYTAYRDRLNPPSTEWCLGIARSTDGGLTWNLKWQTGFDKNNPGDVGNVPTCLAIDSQGNLHLTWYHSVSSYTNCSVHYNRFDAATNTWGTEVALSGVGTHSTAAIAIDSQDYLWLVHSSSGWNCTVVRSDKPTASDMKFSNANPAFNPSATCSNVSFLIDALDRVHISFYATANGATVHHMWLDPAAATPAWSTLQPLGNNNAQADYYSSMAADALGNVYIVYGVDVQSGKTADPYWELRKWDGATQTLSSPVPIYKTTRAQYKPSTDNDGRVICGACDEATGEFYFIYRDFDSGQFLLGRWHDGDAAPTTFAKLATTGSLPPNSLNYMIYPNFRGTLFPAFNQTRINLDFTYCLGDQTTTMPVYTYYFDSIPIGSLSSTGVPRIGTAFPLDLAALQESNKAYVLALSLTGLTPGLPIDRRYVPLVADNLFFTTAANNLPSIFQNFTGVLDASGSAQATFHIPNIPALVSVAVYGAFVTAPGGPAGIRVISNPYTFTITQ